MTTYLKELIVILGLAIPTFLVLKPLVLNFTSEADFNRRRNIWLTLTIAAFTLPSFWLFLPVAIVGLYWGGKRDTNPIAFFLLLMIVIPATSVELPTFGLDINRLFEITIFRLLSLCVLIPSAIRAARAGRTTSHSGFRTTDLLLLGYGILQVFLFIPPDLPNHVILHNSLTNDLRSALLFVLDAYLLYYVSSRTCTSRHAIADAIAAFCLAACIQSVVAAFESLKHWQLYTDLSARWSGFDIDDAYLVRAGLLRAKASTGNALALGYLLAIGFGFWLYLKPQLKQRFRATGVTVLLWMGLIASFSRGPWVGAILIYITFTVLRARSAAQVVRAAAVVVILSAMVLVSPFGRSIAKELPFLGGAAAEGTLSYRELLLERSWQLIQQHPYLGDQDALQEMGNLRQGQGIIDIVNTYVYVALFYGISGLSLFLGFILSALIKAYRQLRLLGSSSADEDTRRLGACTLACIVGTLLMLADCSFIQGYAQMFYVLAGFAVAFVRLAGNRATQLSAPSLNVRVGEPR